MLHDACLLSLLRRNPISVSNPREQKGRVQKRFVVIDRLKETASGWWRPLRRARRSLGTIRASVSGFEWSQAGRIRCRVCWQTIWILKHPSFSIIFFIIFMDDNDAPLRNTILFTVSDIEVRLCSALTSQPNLILWCDAYLAHYILPFH